MKTQCVPAPENNWPNGGQTNWVYPVVTSNPAQTSLPYPVSQGVQSSPKLTPVFYTIEEAAMVLNVCTKTVRRLIARRYLTASKVLRKKLIPRSQIEAFLKATCENPITRI